MRLADKCLDKFAQRSLNAIGNIEQVRYTNQIIQCILEVIITRF